MDQLKHLFSFKVQKKSPPPFPPHPPHEPRDLFLLSIINWQFHYKKKTRSSYRPTETFFSLLGTEKMPPPPSPHPPHVPGDLKLLSYIGSFIQKKSRSSNGSTETHVFFQVQKKSPPPSLHTHLMNHVIQFYCQSYIGSFIIKNHTVQIDQLKHLFSFRYRTPPPPFPPLTS